MKTYFVYLRRRAKGLNTIKTEEFRAKNKADAIEKADQKYPSLMAVDAVCFRKGDFKQRQKR